MGVAPCQSETGNRCHHLQTHIRASSSPLESSMPMGWREPRTFAGDSESEDEEEPPDPASEPSESDSEDEEDVPVSESDISLSEKSPVRKRIGCQV